MNFSYFTKKAFSKICLSVFFSLLIVGMGCNIITYASEVTSNLNENKIGTTQVSPYSIENGVYFIRNIYSGKYLDVLEQSTENGTAVIQNEYSGQRSQQFQVQYESDGYYTLRPLHANLESAVDLQSSVAASVNGTIAQIWGYNSFFEEQKFIIDYDSRYIGYQIGTKCSGGTKVLGVVGSSLDDLALIEIWDMSFYDMNDNWIFEKVNFGSAPTYESIQSSFPDSNCAGFALRENIFIDSDDLNVQDGDSVETVAESITNFFNTHYTRTIRRVYDSSPTYEINSNEYRVALRVRNRSDDLWDYHFMLQLNDGSWAHKQGRRLPEYLGFINPSTFIWSNENGIYDSNTLYFAVSY